MKVNGLTLPSVFLLGAQKCGTSSLAFYLESCSEAKVSNLKEPNFFVSEAGPYLDGSKRGYKKVSNLEEYSQLYEGTSGSDCFIDASTDYLYRYSEFYENLKRLYGDKIFELKFIAILRCPAERAFSSWKMFKRDSKENLEFRKAVLQCQDRIEEGYSYNYDYIGYGEYFDAINYLESKGLTVKVVRMDELLTDPVKLIKQLTTYLGLKFTNNPQALNVQVNKSGNERLKFIRGFLLNDNPIKSFLKKIISKNIRFIIKYKILNATTTDNSMSNSDKTWYYETFPNAKDVLKKINKIGG